jgi:hypothetical protein
MQLDRLLLITVILSALVISITAMPVSIQSRGIRDNFQRYRDPDAIEE